MEIFKKITFLLTPITLGTFSLLVIFDVPEVENGTFSGPLSFTNPIIEDDTDGKTVGKLGVLHRRCQN